MTLRAGSLPGAAAPAVRQGEEERHVKAARPMHWHPRIALALFVAVLGSAEDRSAAAANGQGPACPCTKRMFSNISPAQVWNGPPLDTAGEAWRDDSAVAELAGAIASRRT